MLLSVSRRIPVTSDITRIQTDFHACLIVVDGYMLAVELRPLESPNLGSSRVGFRFRV